jgi:hypothetical protein
MQVDSRLQNPGYIWRVGAFARCNNTCGSGTQVRQVFCASASGPLAGNELCPQTDKPVAIQTCTDFSGCSYAWSIGNYSLCSTMCGVGTKRRTVACLRTGPSSSSVPTIADSSHCSAGSSTPVNSEPCFELEGCSYEWHTGDWSECSDTCGSGIHTRAVHCKRDDGVTVESSFCSASTAPNSVGVCSDASGCVYQYVDECATGTHSCSSNAKCTDTLGSFQCICNTGFGGSGVQCADVNECSSKTPGYESRCTHAYSKCFNTPGSYICVCKEGTYLASGGTCVGCPNGTTTALPGATSVLACSVCREGYYGSPENGCKMCPEGTSSVVGTAGKSGCNCKPGYERNITVSNDSCIPINPDSDTAVFLASLGLSCSQFCTSIGRTCQQQRAKTGYSFMEIQSARSRSAKIINETQLFYLPVTQNWYNARYSCLSVGADAATAVNQEEYDAISSIKVCEDDICLLGITRGSYYDHARSQWIHNPEPTWIDGTKYNFWHPLSYSFSGYSGDWGDVLATLYQDQWLFEWQHYGGTRMLPVCKRFSTVLPESCAGGMRTSDVQYAPFVSSDSKVCYSAAVEAQEGSCSAVPNRGHSRLCYCSAPCLENYYKSGDVCEPCPPPAKSVSGSVSVFDCQCPEGYFMLTSTEQGGKCVKCPAFSTSVAGASSLADCRCFSGFYLNESLQCAACPASSTSPSGSLSLQNCICPAGTYGTPWITGCRTCPHVSRSAAGSTDISQCYCPEGFGIARLGYIRYLIHANDTCERERDLEQEIGAWILGHGGQSCQDACKAKGKTCLNLEALDMTKSAIQALSQPENFDQQCGQIIEHTYDGGGPYPSISVSGSACYHVSASVTMGGPPTCSRSNPDLRAFCFCTCPKNHYGSGGNCRACPANSTAPAGSKYASDCTCLRGFVVENSSCVRCSNGMSMPAIQIRDIFNSSGTNGWQGSDITSTCGKYGSVLGGVGELGDKSYVKKVYTNLCRHKAIYLSFSLLAIDGWEGETISLFADDLEVSQLYFFDNLFQSSVMLQQYVVKFMNALNVAIDCSNAWLHHGHSSVFTGLENTSVWRRGGRVWKHALHHI